MIIPKDAIIAVEKVRDYLLKPLLVDDKSKFLMRAGYVRDDYWILLRDLRDQLLPGEGSFQERKAHGDLYELAGTLHGPNGKTLAVKIIWLHKFDGEWKFVTLFPWKEKKR